MDEEIPRTKTRAELEAGYLNFMAGVREKVTAMNSQRVRRPEGSLLRRVGLRERYRRWRIRRKIGAAAVAMWNNGIEPGLAIRLWDLHDAMWAEANDESRDRRP